MKFASKYLSAYYELREISDNVIKSVLQFLSQVHIHKPVYQLYQYGANHVVA